MGHKINLRNYFLHKLFYTPQILAVEPNIKSMPTKLRNIDNVVFADYRKAIEQADVVLLLVDHKEFKLMDKCVLEGKIIIDTRGIWR